MGSNLRFQTIRADNTIVNSHKLEKLSNCYQWELTEGTISHHILKGESRALSLTVLFRLTMKYKLYSSFFGRFQDAVDEIFLFLKTINWG